MSREVERLDEGFIHQVARVCHDANKAYCETIGDFSQVSWDEAPVWQRESALDGVKFLITHPDAQPGDSHANWLKVKAAEGWRYGADKDTAAKLHPCMLPYEKLEIRQRRKDYIFIGIVKAFLTSSPSCSTQKVGEDDVRAYTTPVSGVVDVSPSFSVLHRVRKLLSEGGNDPKARIFLSHQDELALFMGGPDLLGSKLAGEVLVNGRCAITTLFGHEVVWDAPETKVCAPL